ncbi:MAG: DUF1501 domain-containing protein, partial [Pirellulaceae bacterium]|nr:DUF1501 domain-containing protein [Pirellulaceae bacterium]
PQHDTIDPKPEAPVEIRGEFRPIATKLPGFMVSELMPRVASVADRIAFIRSLVGSAGAHDAFQCQSGFPAADLKAIGGRPAMGSVVNKVFGSPSDAVPCFVDLMQGRPLVRDSARAGFLGQGYAPFRPDMSKMFSRELEPGMVRELAARGPNHTMELSLTEGLTLDRIDDRMQLLARFDRFQREVDGSGAMDAMDKFSQQAIRILTSGRLAEALDFAKEPESVLKLYSPEPTDGGIKSTTSEDEQAAKKLLLARRLVQSGVRCVSVSFSDFDTHSKNFPRMRNLMPIVDHALHALLVDLESHGMLQDVVVVVWGEFGRTPRVNASGGRDHWPEVGPAMMFGGGIRGGQVIGATDRLGAKVVARPVTYQAVFATLYRCLNIDLSQTTLIDPTGRPQHLLDKPEWIEELI